MAEIAGLLSDKTTATLKAAVAKHARRWQERRPDLGSSGSDCTRESTDAARAEQGSPPGEDTVDGAVDHQLNHMVNAFCGTISKVSFGAIDAAVRVLDVRTGGSGGGPLPLVEAFVRRYAPIKKPWHLTRAART